jgi:hypothetical protein
MWVSVEVAYLFACVCAIYACACRATVYVHGCVVLILLQNVTEANVVGSCVKNIHGWYIERLHVDHNHTSSALPIHTRIHTYTHSWDAHSCELTYTSSTFLLALHMHRTYTQIRRHIHIYTHTFSLLFLNTHTHGTYTHIHIDNADLQRSSYTAQRKVRRRCQGRQWRPFGARKAESQRTWTRLKRCPCICVYAGMYFCWWLEAFVRAFFRLSMHAFICETISWEFVNDASQ